MTATLPLPTFAIMENDPHDTSSQRHEEAARYALPTHREWTATGWRSWTLFLGLGGVGFSIWSLASASTTEDAHRIVNTLASIFGGGAILTGFLWKLLGENSLTVIKMKDELIAELRRTHSHEIGLVQRDIITLKEELQQLRELNLALQRYNLDLTGERDDLLAIRASLERTLETTNNEKSACESKAVQLREMLDLAQRRITILSSSQSTAV